VPQLYIISNLTESKEAKGNMENRVSIWRTVYVAEGAKISKKQFEDMAEIAGRINLFAQRLNKAGARK